MFKKNKKDKNSKQKKADKKINDKKFFSRLKFIFSDSSPDSGVARAQSAVTFLTVPVLLLGIIVFAVQALRYHEYKISHAMPDNTTLPMRFGSGDASQAVNVQSMTYKKTLISPDRKDMVIYIKTGLNDVTNFNLPINPKEYKVYLFTTDQSIKYTDAKMGWYGLNTIYIKLHTDKAFPKHAFAVMLSPTTYLDFKTQTPVSTTENDSDFTQINDSSASSSSQKTTEKDNTPKNPYYAVRVSANEAEQADITSGGKINFKKVVEATAFKDKMTSLTDDLKKAKQNVANDKKRLKIAKKAYADNSDSDRAQNTLKTVENTLEDDELTVADIEQSIKRNQDKLSDVKDLKEWSTKVKRINWSTSRVVH